MWWLGLTCEKDKIIYFIAAIERERESDRKREMMAKTLDERDRQTNCLNIITKFNECEGEEVMYAGNEERDRGICIWMNNGQL